VGTSSSPLCTTPSDFRWSLIFDQTASYGTPRWLWGSPQAPKGGVSPIPRIVACGVWGVGPLPLVLQWSCLPVVWGVVSCLFCLYGLAVWGCTIPLWGGGFDGEATPLVWATGWGQNSGSCVTPGVVWGGIYWGRRAFGLLPLIACKSPSHWAVIHCCLGTLYCTAFFPEALRSCPRPLPFLCRWGPHSLFAGALGHSPLPLGCSAGPAVPPLRSVWRFC
jgi:hypothetical protein